MRVMALRLIDQMRRFHTPDIRGYRLAFLLGLCFILGGTSQDVFILKGPLYSISLFFIAATLTWPQNLSLNSFRKLSVLFLGVFFLLHILYIVPLPPGIWSSLSGRENLIEGFNIVGMALPWLPLSVTPERTLTSLLGLIPMIALVLVVLDADKGEIRTGMISILVCIVLSVCLAGLQFITQDSMFYLYDITNMGLGVGLFSNANHQASFLVIGALVALYLWYEKRRFHFFQTEVAKKPMAIVVSIFVLAGVIMAGSAAGYILLAVIPFLSFVLYLRKLRFVLLAIVGGIVLVVGAFIIDSLFLDGQIMASLNTTGNTATMSRAIIWGTTIDTAQNLGYMGGGPGAFKQTYFLFEDRSNLTPTFAPHAHNDFLQIWHEFGVCGIGLIITFLVWFAYQAVKLIANVKDAKSVQILALMTVFVFLLHSFVDYPLRTPANGALFVFFLILLDRPRYID